MIMINFYKQSVFKKSVLILLIIYKTMLILYLDLCQP